MANPLFSITSHETLPLKTTADRRLADYFMFAVDPPKNRRTGRTTDIKDNSPQ
jgi:hypothetical protein